MSQESRLDLTVEIDRELPVPPFWKTRLDETVMVPRFNTDIIAVSPGSREIAAFTSGTNRRGRVMANYNSAIGAGDASYFRARGDGAPPVLLLIAGIHGHEVEGIAGLLNLLNIVESGQDLRGMSWPRLQQMAEQCRLIVVPVANPDGRARCGRSHFLGVSAEEMSRVGQGTRRDGTLYGWPGVKQVHPMTGDVGLLGAYFNDDGINLMHDDFFAPMARETAALLNVARTEAPDIILNLHSHGGAPVLLPTAYVPRTHREREFELARRVRERYLTAGLPAGGLPTPAEDGVTKPPPAFNLTSALHHVSGALSMLFESPHGLAEPQYTRVTLEQILDLHLVLFEELFACVLNMPGPLAGDVAGRDLRLEGGQPGSAPVPLDA